MNVAVFGGSGRLGKAAIQALRAAGHRPANFDLTPDPARPSAFLPCDATDFGQVVSALTGADGQRGKSASRGQGFDAILHLAGFPGPGRAADEIVFRVNMLTTYNLFSAAARLGIRRVVWGSSETIFGLLGNEQPAFAPLDESHPARPQWTFALSKQLGESVAAQFVEWYPDISAVSLRFASITEPQEYASLGSVQASPRIRAWNLWSYVDIRDAAEACRLAIEAPIQGHETLLIAAADTLMPQPSGELMAGLLPGVPLTKQLSGWESLFSSAKAARLIGYAPQHSWRADALT